LRHVDKVTKADVDKGALILSNDFIKVNNLSKTMYYYGATISATANKPKD